MICLGLEICHYKQLLAISPSLIRALEEKIDTVIKQNDVSPLKRKGGCFLLDLGEEAEADPKNILDAAFQLAAALGEFREKLYGYNLLLSTQEDKRPANLEARITAEFLELWEDEGLWVPNRDCEMYQAHAELQPGELYSKIIETKKVEPAYNVISYVPLIRKKAIGRLAQVFLKWFTKKEQNPQAALVTGPVDSAKREMTAAALNAVLGDERAACVQTVGRGDLSFTPLAPLLASIQATRGAVLKRLPEYLEPHERRIWKAYESFLYLLLEGRPVSGDHTEEDFFIVYHLYLTGYFRLMRELHLPGIMVFHHPEQLAGSLVERLKTLFADLARRFRIAVILVSTRPDVSPAFRDFGRLRVTIQPFGANDIRRCFAALYPGVTVPRKAVEHILRLSRGRYGAILHFIYHLRLNRKIVQDGNRFAWVPKKTLRLKIPVRQQTASAIIIRSLKEEARTILYTAFSLGGFFSDAELLDFFTAIGLNAKRVEEQLTYLKSMELYFGAARPRFSAALKGVLRRLSPPKTKYLDEQMRAYVREHLAQFVPARAARCFRFLSGVGAGDLVVDELGTVVNYFLDVRLLSQAAYFLKPEHFLRREELSEERRKRLEYILFAYRIRFHLLTGDAAAADKLVSRSTLPTESLVPLPYFGRLYLELGRYHLCREEEGKALGFLKKAVHYFQELNMTGPSSEAFLELGCGFLAKGNLKEALEYFSFAKKLIQDITAPFIHVRSLWFESVALYLAGNYSRILGNCDEAALLFGAHGFREAELLFGVLKARVMFDLGFYDRAAHCLREGLCLARLYGQPGAALPLFAWQARAAAYQGQTEYALDLLKTLAENEETLFIRGEAYFLAGEDKRAEKVFNKALHRQSVPPLLFPEYNEWRSGFSLVEGRCLALNVHGTPLTRLARVFRAVLQCRAGNLEDGIAELHLLTSTEKFAEADPHVYLFYFLYYMVLKTMEKNKTAFKEIGHGLTILNKSLKHLQERSTLIDEPRDRIHYVTQNYWNKQILQEAKENKLV